MVQERGLLAFALAAALCVTTARAEPPAEPLVIDDMPTIGKQGGSLHTLVSRSKDVRLLYVYGHARLVNYTPDLELFADILRDYEVEEGRIFTFHLREGHRWSDGHPFTAEDFRFYWEDIAQNEQLSPAGPPIDLVVDGERATFEVLDDHTVRYSWSSPNPSFIPSLSAASIEFIYAPAHYLRQFHESHQDPDKLAQMVAEDNARDWAQLFGRRERMNKFDNPDLPTLQPWMLQTQPPANRFIAVRNPHFHRVDPNGVQLPYIDELVLEVVDNKLIPIKTGAGETDLQARGLSFSDYTFLKESSDRSGLRIQLWPEAKGSRYAIYPNLNAADPAWRELFREQKFRHALSIAVDREALNQYLYYGLGTPANNTILKDSPLYTEEIGNACLGRDVEKANALLDELGLDERTSDGIRKLPDGRPFELVVETAGEGNEESDVLELVADAWSEIGLRIHTRPSEREVLRNRIFSGEALMTLWYGIENAIPTASMSPEEFAPTSQYDQPQWPKWGQYYETKGEAGEPPQLASAQELMDLFHAWGEAREDAEQKRIWSEILPLYANECFTIGTVANVLQPVAIRKTLVNVPEKGVFNWEPHAQFGIYMPDTFWFDEQG